jgi:hypothetical protein
VRRASASLRAQSAKESEEDYYPLIKIPVPAGVVLAPAKPW